MKKYTALKTQYPKYISLDQLYRICKISKRSALYLIEHKIIPAIDTGKITWRYKIAIADVITYLNIRDKSGSMIPPGAVSSRKKERTGGRISTRKSFSQIVTQGQEQEIAEYFSFIYAEYDEVLSTNDVAEMTGLNKSTILKLLQNGYIKSLADTAAYRIPKQYLLEFVVTRRFIEAQTKSETFKKILGGFEIWKSAKSSR
jgi:excisionase family DNA binding protein